MTRYLNEKEVSAITGIPLQTLRNYRCKGVMFPFIKLTRAIRYREQDIHSFMEARRVRTADSRDPQEG
jgi:predicted site-specific integrase-resolvase